MAGLAGSSSRRGLPINEAGRDFGTPGAVLKQNEHGVLVQFESGVLYGSKDVDDAFTFKKFLFPAQIAERLWLEWQGKPPEGLERQAAVAWGKWAYDVYGIADVSDVDRIALAKRMALGDDALDSTSDKPAPTTTKQKGRSKKKGRQRPEPKRRQEDAEAATETASESQDGSDALPDSDPSGQSNGPCRPTTAEPTPSQAEEPRNPVAPDAQPSEKPSTLPERSPKMAANETKERQAKSNCYVIMADGAKGNRPVMVLTDEDEAYEVVEVLEAAGAVLEEPPSYELVQTVLRH